MVLLGEERKAVLRGWQEKGDWLRQVSQLFYIFLSRESVQWPTAIQPTVSFRRGLYSVVNVGSGGAMGMRLKERKKLSHQQGLSNISSWNLSERSY